MSLIAFKTRGIHGSVWIEFGQTQDPNHIEYSDLGEVKCPFVILMSGFGLGSGLPKLFFCFFLLILND